MITLRSGSLSRSLMTVVSWGSRSLIMVVRSRSRSRWSAPTVTPAPTGPTPTPTPTSSALAGTAAPRLTAAIIANAYFMIRSVFFTSAVGTGFFGRSSDALILRRSGCPLRRTLIAPVATPCNEASRRGIAPPSSRHQATTAWRNFFHLPPFPRHQIKKCWEYFYGTGNAPRWGHRRVWRSRRSGRRRGRGAIERRGLVGGCCGRRSRFLRVDIGFIGIRSGSRIFRGFAMAQFWRFRNQFRNRHRTLFRCDGDDLVGGRRLSGWPAAQPMDRSPVIRSSFSRYRAWFPGMGTGFRARRDRARFSRHVVD